jgi:hypothetical protein
LPFPAPARASLGLSNDIRNRFQKTSLNLFDR